MIPKRIFQTFEHGNFELQFQYIVDDWRVENPEYDYQFFDANDRQIFMRHFFQGEVYDAYNRILPGAFKSDLWRYCILYVYASLQAFFGFLGNILFGYVTNGGLGAVFEFF